MNTFQLMPKGLLSVVTLTLALGIASCNNGSDEKSTSSASNADTAATVAPATDTTAAATPKKTRKGKASAMMAAADKKMKVEKDKDGIYTYADHMPEYPGGDAALSKYIEENISYPQDAIDGNREGTVKVSFVVDEKGMIMNPKVSGNATNSSLDAEAERVVKKMPAWKPGTVKGKSVKTRLELPITFKLADS